MIIKNALCGQSLCNQENAENFYKWLWEQTTLFL